VYEIESWHQKKLESNIKKQMLLNIGAKVKPHSNILSQTTNKNL
jgi:macrodomain Ter protein organizer (MatP/YcbG family)